MPTVRWPLAGVIFDLDGTLMRTQELQYDFHKYIGLHPLFGAMDAFPEKNEEFWTHYNAAYKNGGLSGLYSRYGNITAENFDQLYPAIEEEYATFIKHSAESPTINVDGDDIADAVRHIWERGGISDRRDTRVRLAVNTTKEKRNARALLERAGLWKYFDTSVTYDDVVKYAANGEAKKHLKEFPDEVSVLRTFLSKDTLKSIEKPNALSTLITLYRLGLPADRVIVFEDTPAGVQSAKHIPFPHGLDDLFVIGVTWGFEKDPNVLRTAGADEIITHPSQCVDIVERLGGFS